MRRLFKRDPDPFSTSRYDGIVRGVKTRERKHMRHWWQWAIVAVLVVLLAIGGYGVRLYFHTQGQFQHDIGTVTPRTEPLTPFNALLVGSDSRAGLTPEEQESLGANAVGGERADTLILAHIDPANNHVVMIQFPRDLWVPIAGAGTNKINSALEGGPDELVRTVKNLTGLPINQYVQVNIAGFRDLVDAIGGVDVCITEPIPFDPHTGIEITEDELGMVHFDGDRALRFVRSRHFTTGDFERIQNQQKFIAAAINKIVSGSTFLHPSRITKLAEVAGKNLVTDQNTTINGLRHLAERLRGFDPEHYEAYIAPNDGIGNVDGISTVVYDEAASKVMFEAIKNNESPAEADGVPSIEPSTIRVGVYNGTGIDGTATTAASELEDATDIGDGPVDVVEIADAAHHNFKETVVRYRPDASKMAEVVAAAIPGARLEEGPTDPDADVAVIVGTRFRTKQLVEIIPIPIPKPGEVPEICRGG
ncbi:MAG TPA: LCP family protein [Actinomycetota bacterium]|nr:LCP family protein [Actinomycetota bacterium]